MSVVDKIRAFNGVTNYLEKNGIKTSRGGHKQNKVMIDFLRTIKVPYTPFNKKGYRGRYDPSLDNAYVVQEYWDEFTKYVEGIKYLEK